MLRRKERSTIHDYPFHACFSKRETELLKRIYERRFELSNEASGALESAFDRSLSGLLHLAQGIDSCPSLYSSESFAGRTRGFESLVDALCASGPAEIDFHLPTRAILSQAFLRAKINFFKAIVHFHTGNDSAADILGQIEAALEELIYSKLAEELLIGSVTNQANQQQLKKAAARRLLPMWENRQEVPVEDFTNLLVSAWRARCRVHETFGTLVGVQEVFSLLRAECEPRFLDFFTREWVTADELEAFREFLFGLSYEELQKLRTYMEENNVNIVGQNDVWRILGRPPPRKPDPRWNAESVYVSYRRRRIRSDYRRQAQSPGPRKTAEGYLMEYYLLHASRRAEEPAGQRS